METNMDTEDQINRALYSVKNTELVELPYGFADKVINKLHASKDNVRSLYAIPPLLKVAAMIVLVLVNVFTLKLAFSSQPVQSNSAQYVTIKDFVSDYQIDANDELVTINIPAHE